MICDKQARLYLGVSDKDMTWHHSCNVLVLVSLTFQWDSNMWGAFVQRRLQVVVFYPADWDPECQAILSAFSALSDQFASCHVSMHSNLNWMGVYCLLDKKDGNLCRPLSLGAQLTAWAATSHGQGAASPQHFLSSQTPLANWRIGESSCFSLS